MKIALAQIRSKPGDVIANIAAHCSLIDHAVARQADLIVFPELSITGYEPSLARRTMRDLAAWRMPEFQRRSDAASLHICFGAPIVGVTLPRIGAILIQPEQQPTCYSKMCLHSDELPFFEAGDEYTGLLPCAMPIGLAICYELSIPDHVETVFASGAKFYLASVAKSSSGVANAAEHLKRTATQHNTFALMVNGIGPSDNFVSSGKSAVWNHNGELLADLDESRIGLLYFETETSSVETDHLSE